MIITVASYKGGVGKTTTAIHLAAYLQSLAPTLLIDGDVIRAATQWAQRGNGGGFPFKVVDETQGIKAARDFVDGHIVIDTEANPSRVDSGKWRKAAISWSSPPCQKPQRRMGLFIP